MKKFLFGALLPLALALALPGCVGTSLPALPDNPAAIADRTAIDEQVGLTITLAYTGASRAAALAIRTRPALSPATIRKIGSLDRTAFAAVEAVRAAYKAGNSDSYAAALTDARMAVAALLTAATGEPT